MIFLDTYLLNFVRIKYHHQVLSTWQAGYLHDFSIFFVQNVVIGAIDYTIQITLIYQANTSIY
jgi:hypothetical protein